ncbi:MAG: GNAT family N-acetyltransferase [Acholeplasmataceae bacterium]|jgi:RimJ/RimL family protein N-acetyltransferase
MNKFEIKGRKIKLRPFQESDIEDEIRWNTIDIEWQNWDAPWEEIEKIDPILYREKLIIKLKRERPKFYYSLEIEELCEGKHIGRVNSYSIDKNYNYVDDDGLFTIGIGIKDLIDRRKGFATEAWILFIEYALENGIEEIYTQTWSGNFPVHGLINKIGFEHVHTKKGYHFYNGKYIDGYTYKLNLDKFNLLKEIKRIKKLKKK